MSDSVQPHRWQPTRPPHPWDSPGKNTGVGCHFLLQCMKVKSESEVAQSVTPWTAAFQVPPSMGFSRQEYWSGVPLPSPSLPKDTYYFRFWIFLSVTIILPYFSCFPSIFFFLHFLRHFPNLIFHHSLSFFPRTLFCFFIVFIVLFKKLSYFCFLYDISILQYFN